MLQHRCALNPGAGCKFGQKTSMARQFWAMATNCERHFFFLKSLFLLAFAAVSARTRKRGECQALPAVI